MIIPKEDDAFSKMLYEAIQKRIDAIISEEIFVIKQTVERRVRAEVGSIAATVCQKISYETFGPDTIRIIVEFKK